MRKRGWFRALLIIIPYIIAFGLGEYIGALIVGVSPVNMDARTGVQEMLVTFFSVLFACSLVYLFVRFVDRESFMAIGWQLKVPPVQLAGVSAAVVGAFMLGFVLLLITRQIQFIGFNLNWAELGASLLLFLFVAINEELLVRGYILKNLLQSTNEKWALLLSSALFAALHMMNPNVSFLAFVNLFLAGILLGTAYLLGRGLWMPICIHFFWNFTQTHLGYSVSGMKMYSLIRINETHPSIWNGGEFGFEGSILAVVFQMVAIAVMWQIYIKNRLRACESGQTNPMQTAPETDGKEQLEATI